MLLCALKLPILLKKRRGILLGCFQRIQRNRDLRAALRIIILAGQHPVPFLHSKEVGGDQFCPAADFFLRLGALEFLPLVPELSRQTVPAGADAAGQLLSAAAALLCLVLPGVKGVQEL